MTIQTKTPNAAITGQQFPKPRDKNGNSQACASAAARQGFPQCFISVTTLHSVVPPWANILSIFAMND